jgi:RimJ/RimL family protein N-acetyltransferase/uncharacterized cupin superfamily protein
VSKAGERPPFVVHWRDVIGADDSSYPGSDELHSIGSALGRVTGLMRLGVHHEVLPPGRRTSYPHAERDEEELVFVIEGTPDAWIDGALHRLAPGDAVGFPAGTGIAHTFLNDTDQDARLLVVGERIAGARVRYPLHPEQAAANVEKSWPDAPARPLGPHDGLPLARRERRDGAPVVARDAVPTLETERLVLRKVTMEDAPLRLAMRADPEHTRYLLVAGPPSEDEVRARLAWILRDMTLGRSKGWTVVEKATGAAIGQVAIVRIDAENRTASLAYELLTATWGKGYAREAVARVLRFGFEELSLHRLQAEIDPGNVRSRKVAEAVGLAFEGTLRGVRFFEGRHHDDAIYAVVAG